MNEKREMIVEMTRINKKESGNAIIPFDKWKARIWSNDHNPPYLHIICGDVSFFIENGELLECKGDGDNKTVVYMQYNVKRWLSSQCVAQPKLTNQENAILVWEQLH